MLNISQHNKLCGALWRKYDQEKIEDRLLSQYLSNFYKLLGVEQRITKLDWKIFMYSVIKCP